MKDIKLTRHTLLALALGASMTAGLAIAAFASSSMGDRTEGGNHMIRIPSSGTTSGISHELNPADWYAYRVKVRHADSMFPATGWSSDNFMPTASMIQICNEGGCEAPEINAGPESLDWNDAAKITVLLEAKSCMLCQWQSFEVPLPN